MRMLKQRGLRALAAMLACVLVMLLLPQAQAETDGMVRVKLTQLGDIGSVSFQTTCEYYLQSDPDVRIPSGSSATVSVSGGALTLSVGGEMVAAGSAMALMRAQAGKAGLRFTSPSKSNLYV